MTESEVVALIGKPKATHIGRGALATLLTEIPPELLNQNVTFRVHYPPAFEGVAIDEDAVESWTYGPYTEKISPEGGGSSERSTGVGVFFIDGKLTEARKHEKDLAL